MLPIILAQNLPANFQIKVPPEASTVLLVICGIVVLLFGRSLYWAFVGIAGFLVGMALAARMAVRQIGTHSNSGGVGVRNSGSDSGDRVAAIGLCHWRIFCRRIFGQHSGDAPASRRSEFADLDDRRWRHSRDFGDVVDGLGHHRPFQPGRRRGHSVALSNQARSAGAGHLVFGASRGRHRFSGPPAGPPPAGSSTSSRPACIKLRPMVAHWAS